MALTIDYARPEVSATIRPMSVKRQVVKAAAPKEALEKVQELADRFGMKEFIVFGRILEWFAAQDDLCQRSILGMLDGLEVDAARRYMEKIAQLPDPDFGGINVTPDQAARALQTGKRTEPHDTTPATARPRPARRG